MALSPATTDALRTLVIANDAEINARIAIKSSLDIAYTNLALALLYQGKWPEAKAIYEAWMDKPYDKENTWRDIFLKDLDELEAAGITHPDVKKARKLLK